MERVTYKEKDVLLLEDFNLQIYCGEIMGMIPIDGHGLGAFMKLLQNNLPLYDGYVYYGNETVNSWRGPRKASNRISVIGTQSCLVGKMSVLDNIFVLRQGFRQEIIRTEVLRKQLEPFLADIGIDIPADARVEELPVFARVMVELLRAVVLGHRLIVLNEIGTVISYEEVEKLHEILRHYTKQGFSFLYVSPHHEEIGRICGRVALLVNGRIQKIIQNRERADEAIRLYTTEYVDMVRGHLAKFQESAGGRRKILGFERITGEYVKDLSFSVHEGECLVIQILDNAAFREIKEMLMGNQKPRLGRILRDGKRAELTGDRGIAVIQELPTRTMIFPELSYMENLCISLSWRLPSIWRKHRIRNNIRHEYAGILGEDVFFLPVDQLSEKQKYQLVYTRILLQKPEVVFCIQPFKGADMAHRMTIWKMMELLLNHGIAIVVLALNLADSLSLADRLLVIGQDGRKDEIHRKDFALIPASVPWLHLYREPDE